MMHGIWLKDLNLQYRQDLIRPLPVKGEALIKIRLAGICGTDLELCRGYYPYDGIPGHEFVGDVVAAPTQSGWEGKRVTGEINIACGTCAICRANKPRHCLNRRTLGIHDCQGVFADYTVLPVANLHAVPDQVSDEQAVFTEPIAAALEILEQVKITPQHQVLIIGAGRLGLLIAQCLALTGCHLEVVTRQTRINHLLSGWGIKPVDISQVSPASMDVVIEATGSPDGLRLATFAVRPTGTVVIKSTYKDNLTLNFSALVVNEVTVIGSRCGPFIPALELLNKHQIDLTPLIDAIYPLANGIEAFSRAAEPGALKVLLTP